MPFVSPRPEELDAMQRAPSASDVPRLVLEVKRLRRALKFYARHESYEVKAPAPPMPIAHDRGRYARRTLDGPSAHRAANDDAFWDRETPYDPDDDVTDPG